MSEELTRDPAFREQYAGGLQPDAEFEAALGGARAPRMSMPPATKPLGQMHWAAPLGQKLR